LWWGKGVACNQLVVARSEATKQSNRQFLILRSAERASRRMKAGWWPRPSRRRAGAAPQG